MNAASHDALVQSIRDRLRNEGRARGRPFAELLELYAIERFLHRLGLSAHREAFVLKGAVLLRHWLGTDTRPTRDIDVLGPTDLDEDTFRTALDDIIRVPVEPDGIDYDLNSIQIAPIRAESQLAGLRAKFDARLGRMRLRYQVDAGLGDEVYPAPVDVVPGELLGLEQASVRAYTPYTSIAEKLEAMIVLGGANTRMKDYYDLAELSSHLEFDGEVLLESINRTLARRGRRVGELPLEGLSDAFGAGTLNAQRWTTFVSRAQLDVEADLTATIAVIRRFAEPVLTAAVHGDAFRLVWPPGGPWHE